MSANLRCRTAAAAASLLITLGLVAPTANGAEPPEPKPKAEAPAKAAPGKAPPVAPEPAPLSAEDLAQVEKLAKLLPDPAPAAGLEAAAGWTLADYEDPGQLRKIDLAKCPVKALLSLATAGGKKGKSLAFLTKDLALPDKGAVRVAIYNPGPGAVMLALAISTSNAWIYHESAAQKVDAEAWKVLEFGLAASNFKTERSKWQYTAKLAKPGETKRLGVLLMSAPVGNPAAVYLCGLGTGKLAATTPGAAPADVEAGPPAALAQRIEKLRALLDRMKGAAQDSGYFWPAGREARLRELLDRHEYDAADTLLDEALKDYEGGAVREPKDTKETREAKEPKKPEGKP